MPFVLVLVALVVVAIVVMAAWGVRRLPTGLPPSRDVPGMRSALVFEWISAATGDDETPIPDAVLLDAITQRLEQAGAEPGSWRADREGTVELAGLMLGDAFLLTLGPVSSSRWQLHVYAQPLGGPRYVAPPRTDSMKTVLRAIDRAVRALPGAHVVGWQSRQDSFHGDEAFADSPVD